MTVKRLVLICLVSSVTLVLLAPAIAQPDRGWADTSWGGLAGVDGLCYEERMDLPGCSISSAETRTIGDYMSTCGTVRLVAVPCRDRLNQLNSFGISHTPVLKGVLIANDDGAPTPFQLSCDNSTWKNYTLGAHEEREYSCGAQSRLYVRVRSNGGTVSYTLAARSRFKISWNESRRLWDVFTVAGN